MLILSPTLFIARGGERIVYRHPHDAKLCVKVRFAGAPHPEETAGEVRYWQYLDRYGCDFAHMPRFEGWAATNQGEGAVWELVQDYNGVISPSLKAVLQRGLATHDACRRALAGLKEWILRHGVVWRDLHPRNIVCRFSRPGDFRLILVDGWGNNEFIPVSSWSRTLNRKKVLRRWDRFMTDFETLVMRCSAKQFRPAPNLSHGRRAA
jgi:PhoP regulatory network protein YrbL